MKNKIKKIKQSYSKKDLEDIGFGILESVVTVLKKHGCSIKEVDEALNAMIAYGCTREDLKDLELKK